MVMDKSYRSLIQAIPLVLLLGLLAGCASTGESDGNMAGEGEGDDVQTFTLHIDNDSFDDARVQLLWNGSGPNLGRVRGSTSETFEIPYEDQRFRLRIDVVAGGPRYDTPVMTVQPGQVLRYRIE